MMEVFTRRARSDSSDGYRDTRRRGNQDHQKYDQNSLGGLLPWMVCMCLGGTKSSNVDMGFGRGRDRRSEDFPNLITRGKEKHIIKYIKFVFGREEAKPRHKSSNSSQPNKETQSPVLKGITRSNSSPEKKDDAHSSFFLKIWSIWKHSSCPHNDTCSKYLLQGFLKPFLIGYLAFCGIRCMAAGKRLLANPSMIFRLLTDRKTLNLGLFLGGFGGTFRAINCMLRWIFNQDHPAYALPAAFFGGLFMKFFPSSTLALYLMWKLIEVGYLLGIEEGVLPRVKGSMVTLFATSTAFLFYAAVLEPQNLKPAYLKFLTRLTHNKIGEINRHVLDIFGTHASKLYSHFWPELDLQYTSRVFQESVLLWLIH